MKGRLIILLFIALNQTYAQGIFDNKLPTSRQDTLRGSITPERAWWDLTYYHLDIKVEPDKKYISGSNTVGYKVLQSSKVMQIDLQKPMNITSITSKNKELKFSILLSRSDVKRNDDANAAIKITKYPHLAAFFPKVTIK